MARNKKWPEYKTEAGEKVPSVTTIIGRFKDSGGLLYWANKVGRPAKINGPGYEQWPDGRSLKEAQDPAAAAGTMAHDLVQWDIQGQKTAYPEWPDTNPDTVAKGEAAYRTYKKWAAMTLLQVRHTEVALVSERYKYGGRLDAIGIIGGLLVLLDWKSSNSVYVDYILQMAAYGHLWQEHYPDHPILGGYYLCRFAKEEGDFSIHHFPKLDRELVTFLEMRKLYDLVKDCEKRVR
jgi:hypothetical protein